MTNQDFYILGEIARQRAEEFQNERRVRQTRGRLRRRR